jgi:hypothetical protein
VREQARDLGLFDTSKARMKQTDDAKQKSQEEFENTLEGKIETSTQEKAEMIERSSYTVMVPINATRKDLEQLKVFLSKQAEGKYEIHIDIK